MNLLEWLANLGGEAWGELEKLLHTDPLPLYKRYHAQVTDKLWRGSWPDLASMMYLRHVGVEVMINLCAERDQYEPIDGLIWTRIPITDCTAPTAKNLADFLMAVDAVAGRVLYVHCEAGVGRTGCCVAAYRVLRQGWMPEAALLEAMHYGTLLPDQREWILKLKK